MSISFAQFAELEIVIGTILTVSVVPDADRLLLLKVDVGEAEPRQIVSGIREYFTDEQELVGRQCPFVINLEPRKIRGLESNGMILASHTESIFSLLTPTPALPPGTPVR